MFDVLKRHEIQVLRRAGLAPAEVAKLAGVSERSVRRVESEPEVTSLAPAPPVRSVGRPAKVERFRSLLGGERTKDPHVMSLELLRRARIKGYDGGKSASYELIKAIRPERPRPMVRSEGLPGEFTQHDFGHVDVRFVDGSNKRVYFFASRRD